MANVVTRPDRPAQSLPLSKLELDPNNPRFGGLSSANNSQKNVLDHIVENFGVGDVLSSLAVNGYFRAEPLVGRRIPDTDRYTIVEGNRRLAACLVLIGDERASNQQTLGENARSTWEASGRPSIDPVPVICFEPDDDKKELLSYLGVRHISASAPWDSYAKAAWVSEVVAQSELTVAEVAKMVGDKHKTVARLLEGYYFIKQAEAEGRFRPQDSVRSGRGSVSAYPFSWVYTVLGYQAARNFLGLPEGEPRPAPVAAERLPRAELLCRTMFGDKSKSVTPAVSDSRQLGDLASAFADPEKVALLEQGKTVTEITRLTRPIEERLRQGMLEVRLIQQEMLAGLSEQEMPAEQASTYISAAGANRRTASAIEKRLTEIATNDD